MTKKTVWQGGKQVTFKTNLNEDGVGDLYALCGSLDGLSDEELCCLSIAKWETIVQAYEEGATRVRDGGADTCALCYQYRNKNKTCIGCPIAMYVGDVCCLSTPYTNYRPNRFALPPLKQQARDEVAFLYEVLDHIRKENNDG